MTSLATRSLPNRRKRRILAAIVADPYRKLAAIGLATGLWYFLNLQLERTDTLEFQLETKGSAPGQIHVDFGNDRIVATGFLAGGEPLPNNAVAIHFTGPSADIEALRRKRPELRVDLEDRVTDGLASGFVDFDVDKLILPSAFAGLSMVMEPAVIRVNIDRLDNLEITLDLARHVYLDVDDEEVRRRLRLDSATFSPEKVEVTGPTREMERLQAAIQSGEQPFRVTVAPRQTDKNLSVAVMLRAPWRQLRAGGSTLTMKVAQKTDSYTMKVPIDIYEQALPQEDQGQYQVKDGETLRQITLEAGGPVLLDLVPIGSRPEGQRQAALDQWAKDNIALIVALRPEDIGEGQITREATLVFFSGLGDRVERSDYNVTSGALVTLTRKP